MDKVGISVLQRGDAASLRNKMIPDIDKIRGPNVSYSNANQAAHTVTSVPYEVIHNILMHKTYVNLKQLDQQ